MGKTAWLGWLLVGVGFSSASAEGIELVLRDRASIAGDAVRVQDLSRDPLDPALGDQILVAAPQPGHERTLERASILRLFVQSGIRPTPRLRGAQEIVLYRPGTTIGADRVRGALLEQLESLELPPLALQQRWEFLQLPQIRAASSRLHLDIVDAGPTVGRGSLRFRARDRADGSWRSFFATVRRSLLTVALRAVREVPPGTTVASADVSVDTLWVDQRAVWDQLYRPRGEQSGWAVRRPLRGGALVRRQDLRPVTLVHQGQTVDWVVHEGDLLVTLSVRARSDGALGQWILVQSPLNSRLTRVCVIGPGRVSLDPSSEATAAGESHRRERHGGQS